MLSARRYHLSVVEVEKDVKRKSGKNGAPINHPRWRQPIVICSYLLDGQSRTERTGTGSGKEAEKVT